MAFVKVLLFCTCIIIEAGTSHALFKRWIRNINYNNPRNWNVGRLPCENDSITIPDSSTVVYIQRETTLLELTLPMDGDIVLGDSLSLTFGPSISEVIGPTVDEIPGVAKLCHGHELYFNRSQSVSWFDPENWCTAETEDGPCLEDSAIESERIPCSYDDVIFPNEATFYVDMDTSDTITVGRMKLRGKLYTDASWKTFIRTGGGDKEFIRTKGKLPNLNIKEEVCDDVTGCRCGNVDNLKILHKVCALQKPRCPPLRCENLLQPYGACCKLCGTQLNIEYGIGFSMDRIKSLIKNEIMPVNQSRYAVAGVKFTASKLKAGEVRVIITDKGDGSDANYLGEQINSVVMKDIEQYHTYSVISVTMRKSRIPVKVSPQTGGQISNISVVVIIVSCIVFLVLIILLIVFYHRRCSEHSISLSGCFGSSKSRDMEMTTSTVSYVDVLESDNASGFDNPLYCSNQLGKDPMDFYQDAAVKLNPDFSSDSVLQDSFI